MQPNRRRPVAPWDRGSTARIHPVGRARRRWPRAYDGGAPAPSQRYRRSFDGGHPQRVSAMQRFRQSPVKNGLLGLAVAGAAAPIAMQRYQTNVQRNDPSHERLSLIPGPTPVSEHSVSRAWRAAEAVRTAPVAVAAADVNAVREAKIQENMQKYKSYDLQRDLAEKIYDMAVQANVDPDMAFGLVRTESAFLDRATSHVGAMGLTQLMPRTAAWLEPGTTKTDLRNSDTNLRIGFNYLRDLIDKYNGDAELALLAYNRGPGTVDRVLKKGGNPDNGYPDMVLRGAPARH